MENFHIFAFRRFFTQQNKNKNKQWLAHNDFTLWTKWNQRISRLYMLWFYSSVDMLAQLTYIDTQTLEFVNRLHVQLLHRVALERFCDVYDGWQIQLISINQILFRESALETIEILRQVFLARKLDFEWLVSFKSNRFSVQADHSKWPIIFEIAKRYKKKSELIHKRRHSLRRSHFFWTRYTLTWS